jgi:prolipoprotein diacylglyceryltransferase
MALRLPPLPIDHPHFFFEGLAYGASLFLFFKTRPTSPLPLRQRTVISLAALWGALGGAVALDWFNDPGRWIQSSPKILSLLLPGKTLVGGLLGGWAGVELAKKIIHHPRSTGDTFVFPVLGGMMIGRLGCFFAGLADNTYGNRTALPWGVDFGDGVPRHPTALYEILFLGVLGGALWALRTRPREEGDLFKFFMVGYLLFRLLIDFLKPYPRPFFGLGVIQLACLGGLIFLAPHFPRLRRWATFSSTPA